MATFTVDTASLQSLATTLGGLCGQMDAMHDVASGYEGLLGGRDLESMIEKFCSHWHYGIGNLGKDMQHLVEDLGKAAATYRASDQSVAKAATPK